MEEYQSDEKRFDFFENRCFSSSGSEARKERRPKVGDIPEKMRERSQWVARKGKMPLQPNGNPASHSDSQTWSSFEEVLEASHNGDFDGIGFVFSSGDPFVGIDLDHCIEDGKIKPWAAEIVERLNSYTEVSPSGTGLHVIAEGELPVGGCKKGDMPHGGGMEMYGRKRYFTVTANLPDDEYTTIEQRREAIKALYEEHWADKSGTSRSNSNAAGDAPPALNGQAGPGHDLDDDEVLARVRSAQNSAKFDALFGGDTSIHDGDHSRADFALCSTLAFWTGGDAEQMDRLFRRSGLMRRKWNEMRGHETYGQRTIRKALTGQTDFYESSSRNVRPADEPWPVPVPLTPTREDPPSLPLSALPSWMSAFVRTTAAFLQVPHSFPFSLALSAVAGAVQKKAVAVVHHGYTEPLILWTASVLPSGERKSPTFAKVTAPIEAHERAERSRIEPERQHALDKKEVLEKRLKEAKKQAVNADDEDQAAAESAVEEARRKLEEHYVPTLPTLWCDDTTPEALRKLLTQNHGRMISMSPEGDLFKYMGGLYQKNPSLGVYKKSWTGGETDRDSRVGREDFDVTNPALTVGICVQPQVLEQLAQKETFRGEGVLARFFYTVPRPMAGRRKTGRDVPSLDKAASRTWKNGLTKMLETRPKAVENGVMVPHRLELSEDAQHVRWDFEEKIEKQVGPGGRLRHLRDWGGKIVGQSVRVAALLHVAERAFDSRNPFGSEISGDEMERAVAIAEVYIEHALSAFDLLQADERLRLARYVWKRIRERHPDTVRDLWQAAKSKSTVTRTADLDAPLALLEEHNLIRREAQKKKGRGRAPSPLIQINPQALEANFDSKKAPPSPDPQYSPNDQNPRSNRYSGDNGDIEDTPAHVEAGGLTNGERSVDELSEEARADGGWEEGNRAMWKGLLLTLKRFDAESGEWICHLDDRPNKVKFLSPEKLNAPF